MQANNSQLILYKDKNGHIKIDVRFDGDTVWLTQKSLASLFDCSIDNISLHLKNIFESEELEQNSVSEEYSITAADGKSYKTKHYNLDAIKLTGFKSPSSLKEYIKNVISQEKERWVEEMVEKFQIEGEWGKQTPFQQTVNTYIKNRGEEIRKDLLENN